MNKRSSARHLRVRCPLHFVLAVCKLLPFFEEKYSLMLFFCIYFSVKIETVQRNYTSATRIFQDFIFSWQDLSPNVHSVMCMGEVGQDRTGQDRTGHLARDAIYRLHSLQEIAFWILYSVSYAGSQPKCPFSHIHRTGQDRTRQDRTGQDRIGQDRIGQDRIG